jgi:pyruvate/2-oxoglutarate dehydrogenase complex dihydrolipoamide acyltransferase (E2) component
MSLFGDIMNRIFHRGQPQATAKAGGAPAAPPAAPAAPTAPGAPSASAPPQAPAQAPAQTAAPAQPVDVEAVLNQMASTKGQTLNWRTSIVDLMKLLDLDSSLDKRKELARELGYSGDMSDSASMNIWLHKQVMRKLADNGGKVPAELKD